MTFPLSLAVTTQKMRTVNFGQTSITFEQLDDSAKLIHRITTLNTAFQILFKLMRSGNLVCHQIPIFLKNSSLLA